MKTADNAELCQVIEAIGLPAVLEQCAEEMSACASRSWMSPWAEITPPPWRRKSSSAGWTD